MARARTIKGETFRHEVLNSLPFSHRWLFVGLWTIADREGRLEDRPRRIKVDIFPYDDIDVEPLLADLERAGFIRRYEADGKRVIWVEKFLDHQNPHPRETPSVLPGHEKAYPRQALAEPCREKDMPFRAGSSGSSESFGVQTTDSGRPSAGGALPSGEGSSQVAEVKAHLKAEAVGAAKAAAEVFLCWREKLGGAKGPEKPGAAQERTIKARLREGWTVEDLKLVVDGAIVDSERWPERLSNCGVKLLYRDQEQVAKFVRLAREGNPARGPPRDVRRGMQRAEDQGWEEFPQAQPNGGNT